ncbi:MAG: hypothetical protein IJS46_01215, partial [Kiritimatiellae bacterium]|nr:hypothetical protein [Kiritimatiellia bacterium]
MNSKIAATAFISFSLALAAPGRSQGFSLVAGTDKRPVSYKAGDQVKFYLSGSLDGAEVESEVEWTLWRGGAAIGSGRGVARPGEPLKVPADGAEPGFIRMTATGSPVAPQGATNAAAAKVSARIAAGAGVAIGSIKAAEEPDGFDEFWEDIRSEGRSVDVSAARIVPVEKIVDRKFRARAGEGSFAFELPIPGGNSASGFVAVPDGAPDAAGTVVVVFDGYDDSNPNPSARRPLEAAQGCVVVRLSTHGFALGRDRRYYREAFNAISSGGNGGAFGVRDDENADPRTCYFRRIAVRDAAAIRFLR